MEHKQGEVGNCKSYAPMNNKDNWFDRWSENYDKQLRDTEWGKMYLK